MDILEKIYSRRSIREFADKNVSQQDIEKIVEAGLRAPSSKNSCPWHILVLENEEKDEMANWVLENEEGRETKPTNIKTGEDIAVIPEEIRDSTNASVRIVKKASALILIFNKAPYSVSKKDLLENVNESNIYSFVTEILGIGACMENMLLAAHFLGLGAVPLADLSPAEDKVKERYGINYDFAIGIAVGHPAYSLEKRKIDAKNHLNDFNVNLIKQEPI